MADKPIDQRTMLVVGAIRQSIETSGGPGLSVNRHPNAFFLNVNGELDLLRAARLVLVRLEENAEAEKQMQARQETEAAKAAPVVSED